MDRGEALELLRGGERGITEWNRRRPDEEPVPRLDGADLTFADLTRADLTRANLGGANLREANLGGANLREANLTLADLTRADLTRANLGGANLREADLCGADLTLADLTRADLSEADLTRADLSETDLTLADLSGAIFNGSILASVDLSEVHGLESVAHVGPSTVGIDTIFRSAGNIPESFLRGCGVPDALIEYLPSIIHGMQPIQFYSCFISYSTKDEEFTKRLRSRMVQEKLRVWYSPEDIQGGKKLHEQIDQAIRVHDKLLLVLSPNSINSKWVRDEIRRARKAEVGEGQRKLFPVRLMDFEALGEWESFYADLSEDLAEEIREYFVPDFSNWKDHDAFEAGFARLLRDLKKSSATGEA